MSKATSARFLGRRIEPVFEMVGGDCWAALTSVGYSVVAGGQSERAMRYPWPKHVVIGRRRTVDLVLASLGTLVFLALVVGLFFWL
jgi:hypothetical protein